MELQVSALEVTACERSAERDLIERAKRDPHAFAALYRMHHGAIAGYVGRRVGDGHVTEDLVAEVFVTALRTLPRFHYRGVPVRAWLYRIASSAVSRWARRNRRELIQAFEEHMMAGAAGADAPDDVRCVRLALLSLAPKYQTVLALHYLEGMSLQAVAAAVGCRTGTIKSRMSRGRQALREQLARRRSLT